MLSKERIEELSGKVEQGNNAKKLLSEYEGLIEQREHLINIRNKSIKCRKINMEVSYNHSIAFNVNMSDYAISQINKIIDNEIEFIDSKLNNFI